MRRNISRQDPGASSGSTRSITNISPTAIRTVVVTCRPVGCRLYFCQPGTEEWQSEIFEAILDDLRRLHREHAVEYAFIEWVEALERFHELESEPAI